MATYIYRARDKFGRILNGKLEALSEISAGDKLQIMGLTPLNVKPEKLSFKKIDLGLSLSFKRIRKSEIVLFSRQLSVLMDAGVPIINSLESLSQQIGNYYFKQIIGEIISDIRGGMSFSNALGKHPKHFDALYRSIVKAGEASGKFDEALDRLATMGEHEEEMQSRIRSATMYPIIVITALGSAFILMVTFVLPRFAKIFSRFHTKLPLPTRILLAINHIFTHYGLQLLVVAAISIILLVRFSKTRHGKAIFDRLKLKTPVFGPLILKITLSRFTRITASLIKSGIPIIQTLDLVGQTIGNTVLTKAVEDIKTEINAGEAMNEAMNKNKIFPPMVVQMVYIGEESGKLDDLLIKVSDYYDYQVNYIIKNLTTLLEPILLLVLGGAVLFMALSIFLPMWNLIYLFKR